MLKAAPYEQECGFLFIPEHLTKDNSAYKSQTLPPFSPSGLPSHEEESVRKRQSGRLRKSSVAVVRPSPSPK